MTLVFANDYVGRIGLLLAGSSVGLGPLASSSVTFSNLSIQPIDGNIVPEPSSVLLAMLALAVAGLHNTERFQRTSRHPPGEAHRQFAPRHV